jgi:hypothetical protein
LSEDLVVTQVFLRDVLFAVLLVIHEENLDAMLVVDCLGLPFEHKFITVKLVVLNLELILVDFLAGHDHLILILFL